MARVLLFGRLADAAGWRERAVEAGTLAALKAGIAVDAPTLALALDQPGVTVVINDTQRRGDTAIEAGDEVAFLPPMSGG